MMQSDFLKACIDPICFLQVKETGQKENRPLQLSGSQLNCAQRQGASEFLFTEIYHKQGVMTRPFFEIFQENFSQQVLWKIENFEGKWKKMEENDSHHGLAWIGMIYHILQ